jgi:N-acetylneuraminate synthase
MATVTIGNRVVGDGEACFIIAEIGINHNGDLEIAKKLIGAAVVAGCDAVKFQKRTPELCVPVEQRHLMRETPWGPMTYLDYKKHIEFGYDEYAEIDAWCRTHGVIWFASCWDDPSVDLIEQFAPVCHKIPSALLTDDDLLRKIRKTGRPVILSTGMSTMEEVRHAVSLLDRETLLIAQSTSSYPVHPTT